MNVRDRTALINLEHHFTVFRMLIIRRWIIGTMTTANDTGKHNPGLHLNTVRLFTTAEDHDRQVVITGIATK